MDIANPGQKTDVRREVVGIAGDIRYPTSTPGDSVEIYLPYAQSGWPTLFLFVRARTDPTRLARPIIAALRELDRELPVSEPKTMEERLGQINGWPRWNAGLLGSFASIALLLAAFGIYGVIANLAAKRTKEIGVRVALGARRGNILALVMRQGLIPAGTGVCVGLLSYSLLARLLSSFVFGLPVIDVVTLVASTMVLLAIAAIASYVPAVQVLREDPLALLRAE